jgi:Protein of unknown function (DUF2946)
MRPNRLRLGAIAAWLGVIALGFNALVPIHLAFDLADALEPGAHRHASQATGHGIEWRLLALVTGHGDADAKPDGPTTHRHADCAVCSALGTLAGFAPAAAAKLPTSVIVEASTALAAIKSEPHGKPPTAYRSRAPPVSA